MKLKKFMLVFIIIIIICLVMVPHLTKASSNVTKSKKYTTVTVCSGDTLWTIASNYLHKHEDIRELIYDIKKINKLESAIIVPGQNLIIPCD